MEVDVVFLKVVEMADFDSSLFMYSFFAFFKFKESLSISVFDQMFQDIKLPLFDKIINRGNAVESSMPLQGSLTVSIDDKSNIKPNGLSSLSVSSSIGMTARSESFINSIGWLVVEISISLDFEHIEMNSSGYCFDQLLRVLV